MKFKQLVRKDMNADEHERLTIQYVYICFLGVKFAILLCVLPEMPVPSYFVCIHVCRGHFFHYRRGGFIRVAVDCSFLAE